MCGGGIRWFRCAAPPANFRRASGAKTGAKTGAENRRREAAGARDEPPPWIDSQVELDGLEGDVEGVRAFEAGLEEGALGGEAAADF